MDSPRQKLAIRRSMTLSLTQLAKPSLQNGSFVPPLLQLPPEIRNQIWLDVIEGVEECFYRLLQGAIDRTGRCIINSNSCHMLCVTHTLKPLHLRRATLESSEICSRNYWQRGDTPMEKTYNISLEFLRTCRQIYKEAGGLLYSSQIFSFEHSCSLVDFMTKLTPFNCSNLRSLHFTLESNRWARNSRNTIDSSLKLAVQCPALQNLDICIRKRASASSELSITVFLMLKHTTARERVTVILPRRGPFRYAPSVSPPKVQPHPLRVSKKSCERLEQLPITFPSYASTPEVGRLAPDTQWECLEWPAERQLDFACSVIKRLSNPWAQLDPQNYVQDDRPPRFVLFNSIERAFWRK